MCDRIIFQLLFGNGNHVTRHVRQFIRSLQHQSVEGLRDQSCLTCREQSSGSSPINLNQCFKSCERRHHNPVFLRKMDGRCPCFRLREKQFQKTARVQVEAHDWSPYSSRSRVNHVSVVGPFGGLTQRRLSPAMCLSGSKRGRRAGVDAAIGSSLATGFESRVTTISSPSARAFSALGQCRRTSRTVIRVMGSTITCFTVDDSQSPTPGRPRVIMYPCRARPVPLPSWPFARVLLGLAA